MAKLWFSQPWDIAMDATRISQGASTKLCDKGETHVTFSIDKVTKAIKIFGDEKSVGWWLVALIVEIEVHPSPVLATFRSFDYFFKPCFALEIYWCSHNPGRNNSERKNFLVDNPASITIFKITKKLSKLSIPAVSKPSARGNASNIVFLGIFPPDIIVLVRRYIFSFTILGEIKISQIPHLCNIWQHRPIQFQIIQFHASHPKW